MELDYKDVGTCFISHFVLKKNFVSYMDQINFGGDVFLTGKTRHIRLKISSRDKDMGCKNLYDKYHISFYSPNL